MDKHPAIGSCPICGQGILEIVKERSSGRLLICCDECEAEWVTPQDALAGKNGSRNQYGETTAAGYDEIVKAGWEPYLIR